MKTHSSLVVWALLAFGSSALAQSPCPTEVVLNELDGGSSGPVLRTPNGAPVIGGPFSFRIEGAAPNMDGALVFSPVETAVFDPAYGATFHFGQPFDAIYFTTDANGRSPDLVVVPELDPFLCNEFAIFQAGVFDPTATGGVAVTNAIRLRIGEPRGPLFPNYQVPAVFGLPTAAAAGHFDGDSLIDVVWALETMLLTPSQGSLRIGIQTAHGTFETSSLPLPGANAVTTAHLDGDGLLDVLGTSVTSDEAWSFLGNGDGTFTHDALQHETPVGSFPRAVAAPDLDGDGNADLVTADTAAGTVTIRPGNGDGSFGSLSSVPVGGLPHDVVAGDLDGVAGIDLVVAARGFNRVDVLLGDGAGGIASSSSVFADGGPQAVALADLNQDGDLDLLTACFLGDALRVRLGNGNGTFGREVAYPTGANPIDVEAADFDLDGAMDVVVAEYGADRVSLYHGDGTGGLGAPRSHPASPQVRSLAIADVGDDGMPDLFVVGDGASDARVLPQRGDGTIVGTRDLVIDTLEHGSSWERLDVHDVNADGVSDFVVFRPGASLDPKLGVYLMDGEGSIAGGVVNVLGTPSDGILEMALGDLNTDGLPDLVLAHGASEQILTRLGTGMGTFTPHASVDPVPGAGTILGQLALADLDLDGNLDLILETAVSTGPSTTATSLGILTGQGDGTFAPNPAQVFPLSPSIDEGIHEPTVGDLDGDGHPDIAFTAVTFFLGGEAGVLYGSPTGFSGVSPFSLGYDAWRPTAADVDGDGTAELLYASLDGDLVVRSGGPGGTDTFHSSVQVQFSVADVNGDGALDVVYARGDVQLGDGDGAFGSPAYYRADFYGGRSAACIDLDQDGNLDLAVLQTAVDQPFVDEIAVLENLTGE